MWFNLSIKFLICVCCKCYQIHSNITSFWNEWIQVLMPCVWFNCIHLWTWLVQSTRFHLLTLKRSDTDPVNPNPSVNVSDLELIRLCHIPRMQIAIDGEPEVSQVKFRLPLREGCCWVEALQEMILVISGC